ncbi:hypothetical protein ACROYT_G043463 [Oculina patagonica]
MESVLFQKKFTQTCRTSDTFEGVIKIKRDCLCYKFTILRCGASGYSITQVPDAFAVHFTVSEDKYNSGK